MNALLSTFQSNMNNAIQEYALQISTKFELNQDDLIQIWNNMNDAQVKGLKKPKKTKKKTTTKKRKSGFILFSMENRGKLKQENPNLKFTEISKLLGKNWKSLSDEEKEEYNKKAREEKQSDDITMQSISQLRKMCKEKCYSYYSQLKKQDLIDILTGKKDPPTRKKRGKSPKNKEDKKEKVLRRKISNKEEEGKVKKEEEEVEVEVEEDGSSEDEVNKLQNNLNKLENGSSEDEESSEEDEDVLEEED